MSENLLLRMEQREDAPAVAALLEDAFPGGSEASLVARLRREARPYLGWIAERAGRIVGHILFTPVRCDAAPDARLLGLGPMAVATVLQRRGIGTQLARAGLAAAGDTGARAVFVLGHPGYYPRFGFSPASEAGLRSAWDVPDNAFLVRPLNRDSLEGLSGVVRYHPAFSDVTEPAATRH
jgi:putative acetyltransferase